MKDLRWDVVTVIAIIALTIFGNCCIIEYNKTMQVAFQNGFSNTQGWRK